MSFIDEQEGEQHLNEPAQSVIIRCVDGWLIIIRQRIGRDCLWKQVEPLVWVEPLRQAGPEPSRQAEPEQSRQAKSLRRAEPLR